MPLVAIKSPLNAAELRPCWVHPLQWKASPETSRIPCLLSRYALPLRLGSCVCSAERKMHLGPVIVGVLQGAITKRITAIEEMAGMDILCSDKTGTLTLNKLTVDKTIIEVSCLPEHPAHRAKPLQGPLLLGFCGFWALRAG